MAKLERSFHTQQLPEILKSVHRAATLTALQAHGLDILDWEQIPDKYPGDADFADVVLGDVEYDGEIYELPIRLLGATAFKLTSSYTPMARVLKGIDAQNPAPHERLMRDVDSPVKLILADLEGREAKRYLLKPTGFIFVMPDGPPAAIHASDLHYVAEKQAVDYDDVRIIGLTRQTFGDIAVENLSESVCKIVGAAILHSNPKTAVY